MDQPFILCGLGRLGWRVLEYLQAAGLPVVAIDLNLAPDDPRLGKVRLVKGDCRTREALEAAGVARARGGLILTRDDLVNLSTALMVRSLHPDVRVVMRMFNQNLIARLGKAVTNVFALSTSSLTAPLLALTALAGQALGSFKIHGVPDGRRQVIELAVGSNSPFLGQAALDVAAHHHVQVLAHCPANGKPRFLLDVEAETRLQAGDYLIVCGEPHHLTSLRNKVADEVLP